MTCTKKLAARVAALEYALDVAQYDANQESNCDQSHMTKAEREAVAWYQRKADAIWAKLVSAKSELAGV